MLPADWAEYLAAAERDIKRPPAPVKRRQPKITRHSSARQRIAESQSKNPIKSIYTPENDRNATPTKPETWSGTKEVGPGDVHNSEVDWRSGKQTIEGRITGAKKYGQRTRRTGSGQKSGNIEDLLKEYGV